MSLLVWLPLTDGIENQGLSDVKVVNNGASVNNSGKFGKCYYFNRTSNYLRIDSKLITTSQYSISFWMNTAITSATQCVLNCRNENNGSVAVYLIADTGLRIDTGSQASPKNWQTYWLPNTNTWYHVTFVQGDTTQYFYINGVLITSRTNTTDLSTVGSTLVIGAQTVGGSTISTYFGGKLQDVRIYDHALSVKEIKELSKGLVAHYKLTGALDGINPNMFKELPKSYASTAYLAYQLNLTENLVAGQTYTLHFWNVNVSHSAKSESDLGLSVYWGGGNVLLKKCIGTDYFINGHADHLIFSFTPTSGQASHADASNSWLHIYNSPLFVSGTLNLTIEKWKLEKGSVATPYVKTTEEMGGEDTNIYDCSGYSHHGSALGTLTTSSDTARYSSSTVFDGSNSGVLLEDLVLSPIINNDITYSFWVKPNGENGARSVYFGSFALTSWSVEKTTGNVLRLYWNGSPDESCSGATITDGVWQHICIAKKGTNEIKVYINGVLKWTSTATHNTLNLPTTYRIGRDTRTGATCYCGQMSDFRIYATSLSADDVLELYHTGASVDKNGNMYAYELKEI